MKKHLLVFLSISLSLIACQQEHVTPRLSCEEQYLINNNLLAYVGQDLGCNFYVSLFELDGKVYFYTDNPCVDILSIPIDCEGEEYCSSLNSTELEYFFKHAVNKGIVGVMP